MAKIQQARVLFALPECGAGVNDIIEGSAKLIKSYTDAGSVDPDKDSVSYAKAQGGRIVKVGAAAPDPVEALQAEIDALAQQIADAADADKPALQAALDAKTAELAAL